MNKPWFETSDEFKLERSKSCVETNDQTNAEISSQESFPNDHFSFKIDHDEVMSNASLETPSFPWKELKKSKDYFEMTYNNETPNFRRSLTQTSQQSESPISTKNSQKVDPFKKTDCVQYVFGLDNCKIYSQKSSKNLSEVYESKFRINNLS